MRRYVIFLFLVGVMKAQIPNFQWAREIGPTTFGNYSSVVAITTDGSGNIYTTGTFSGISDFDPGPFIFTMNNANGGVFIAKHDPLGNLIWAKQIGGSNIESWSMVNDASANLYICGKFWSTGDFDPGPGSYTLSAIGNGIPYVLKLDANGNFVWAKHFNGIGTPPTSGTASSLKLDGAGNVITTGSFNGALDFDPGASVYSMTSPSTPSISNGGINVFVSKLDNSGNFIWAKNIGSYHSEGGTSLTTDVSDNVYLTGWFRGSGDFDPGPGTYSLSTSNFFDIFVMKLSSAGGFMWAECLGGAGDAVGYNINMDPTGNIIVAGYFEGTHDFDAGPGTYTMTSAGVSSGFISKLNGNGNFIWAKSIGVASCYGNAGASNIDNAGNITFVHGTSIPMSGGGTAYITQLDNTGNNLYSIPFTYTSNATIGISNIAYDGNALYWCGSYDDAVDLDPGTGNYIVSNSGMGTGIISKLSFGPTSVNVLNNAEELKVYPNPGNGIFKIVSTSNNVSYFRCFNALGEMILNGEIKPQDINSVDISDRPLGIYFLEINTDSSIKTIKLVKN